VFYFAADVEDRRSKLLALNRHFSAENPEDAGGNVQSDDKSDNPTDLTQNVAESSHCYANDRCDDNHGDVSRSTADSAQGNPSCGCRIKKSVSFRAEPKLLSCDAEGDKHAISRRPMCHSAPRSQQQNDQRQQQLNHPASKITQVPSCQTSHNTTALEPNRPSVRTVLRDRNENQGSGLRQSLSKGASERSKSASRLMTRGDTDMEEKVLNSYGSWSLSERQQCPASDHHHPTSINWYVDVTDSSNTEFRPHTSLASSTADRSRQYPCDFRTSARSKSRSVAINDGYKLEPESFRKTAWVHSSAGRGRATTRSTLDQLWQPTHMRHHDATERAYTSSTASALAELGKTPTPLQRTWSTIADRMLERRTSKNPYNDDQARPSISSQFRRSMVATKPRSEDTEMFIDAASVAQPVEYNWKSRTRSVSLSERYRMLIDGDWIDKFASSPTDISQQKLTPINRLHKPLALPRELKPDFIIYV